MFHVQSAEITYKILSESPQACATILGSYLYPKLRGTVLFYAYRQGTIVVVELTGMPTGEGRCQNRTFGFHVHEGRFCTGSDMDPFANTKGHYNPYGCDHPYHAGDMPVLMESQGNVWMAFYTDRFTPQEIMGRTVVIHHMPDDFQSQPSGHSGEKIACGVVR